MEYVQGKNPFEGLDKGDVQLALASEFVQKLREILTARRKEHVQQLQNAAISGATGGLDQEMMVKLMNARGASLVAIDNLTSLIDQGAEYARS